MASLGFGLLAPPSGPLVTGSASPRGEGGCLTDGLRPFRVGMAAVPTNARTWQSWRTARRSADGLHLR